MEALVLFLIILCSGLSPVATKAYSNRVKGGVFSFTAVGILFSMIVFCCTAKGQLDFKLELVPYSIMFAVTFCLSYIGSIMAIKTGSLSLSSLFISYSLLVPTFFGIIFFNEATSPMLYIGIVLLAISLWIINYVKGEGKGFSLKWIIYVIITFVSNGFSSVLQQFQQRQFNSMYKSEFMIMALAIVAVVMFIAAIIVEKKEMISNMKKGFLFSAARGIAIGLLNFFVLLLYGMGFPASVSNPIISAGGIIVTGIISMTVYKERLKKNQIIGMILGIAAIVALNLR